MPKYQPVPYSEANRPEYEAQLRQVRLDSDRLKPVKVTDLMGVPYLDGGEHFHMGLDCWGVARVVCLRARIHIPDSEEWLRQMTSADVARGRECPFGELITPMKPTHRQITRKRLYTGDLVVSDSGRSRLHVNVVFEPAERMTVTMTAPHGPEGGGVLIQPLNRIRRILGIWRITPGI